jgi:hypothetical protein
MAYPKICLVDGCGKTACNKRGWCSPHYRRWLRHGDPLAGNASHGAARAWLITQASYKGEECLPWPFATLENGYGVVRMKSGQKSLTIASRAMCELVHGKPPQPWYEAAHTCGSGAHGCVNPTHLKWTTPVDNRAHKAGHGTAYRGSKHYNSKLTEEIVREIRRLRGQIPQSRLAKRYGVSQGLISQIQNGLDWAWLK